MAQKVNGEEFDRLLREHRTSQQGKLIVADFYADWCRPCKMVAPIVDQLAEKYTNVKFVKVDMAARDRHPEETKDVRGIPTFKIYRNGEPTFKYGGTDMNLVEAQIQANL
jgi:thiol-disulfide isomerase/thioredoxin